MNKRFFLSLPVLAVRALYALAEEHPTVVTLLAGLCAYRFACCRTIHIVGGVVFASGVPPRFYL